VVEEAVSKEKAEKVEWVVEEAVSKDLADLVEWVVSEEEWVVLVVAVVVVLALVISHLIEQKTFLMRFLVVKDLEEDFKNNKNNIINHNNVKNEVVILEWVVLEDLVMMTSLGIIS